jgi:hypothetical protein
MLARSIGSIPLSPLVTVHTNERRAAPPASAMLFKRPRIELDEATLSLVAKEAAKERHGPE